MSAPKMKTFKDANHEAIEAAFNAWAHEEWETFPEGSTMDVHTTEMLFSPALQKFVFTVVYSTQPPE